MTPFCAAVDWGTTRFRLWVLAEDGTVLHETSSDEGLIHAAETGFNKTLEAHLAQLNCPQDLPVVICGMAGARQGWCEAKYVDVPADLHDVLEKSVIVPDASRDVRMLPGIAQRRADRPDVMRGEETQLLGLYNAGALSSGKPQLVCMPGTHSKWVEINGAHVSGFTTFLTGELFSVLAKHSILKMSVDSSQKVAPADPAFLKSLKATLADPATFSASLFSHRSAQLLDFAKPAEGLAALSGTIIGLELAGAFSRYGRPETIILLATGNLGVLYASALEACGIAVTLHNAEASGRDGLYYAAKNLWGDVAPKRIEKA